MSKKNAVPVVERLLTIDEVAERTALTERQVREQIYRGRLRRTKLGRSVRVHPDDLAAFIEAGREPR